MEYADFILDSMAKEAAYRDHDASDLVGWSISVEKEGTFLVVTYRPKNSPWKGWAPKTVRIALNS
jgi:hypothetical protein